HVQIISACRKFNQLPRAIKQRFRIVRSSEIDRDDRWKMSRPFPLQEIVVITGGDNMTPLDVGLIDPILVLQHLVQAAAAEAAMKNMITPFQCLPHTLANNGSARAQLIAQHTEAADLHVWCDLAQNRSDS